jgi:hypothetical protein
MQLLQRLKAAFNPKSHDATLSHYIPSIDYANQPVLNSVWRSDLALPIQDWKGNAGRIPYMQVRSTQGPLLFALKGVVSSGLGGNSGLTFGQYITPAVAGFAGRPAILNSTSVAAEFEAVQNG